MQAVVLLSTLNGANFLPLFLESLAYQNHGLRLLWRDDGSTDRTKEIVKSVSSFEVIELSHSPANKPLGPKKSFGLLLQYALHLDADYFFTADQDDIWSYDKISKIMGAFVDNEDLSSPLLIHHDLRVIDRVGGVVKNSFWAHRKINPTPRSVAELLYSNAVTGCAAAFNRALLELATPIPEAAIMHDWWLGLVAQTFGRVEALYDPMTDYRHHTENYIGHKDWWERWKEWMPPSRALQMARRQLHSTFEQAVALSELATKNNRSEAAEINRYLDLRDASKLTRAWVSKHRGASALKFLLL